MLSYVLSWMKKLMCHMILKVLCIILVGERSFVEY
jgi:hypothetical protein